MKFKIDHNLPVEAADLLAAPDERIVEVCGDEDLILITADLDLSDIVEFGFKLTLYVNGARRSCVALRPCVTASLRPWT